MLAKQIFKIKLVKFSNRIKSVMDYDFSFVILHKKFPDFPQMIGPSIK